MVMSPYSIFFFVAIIILIIIIVIVKHVVCSIVPVRRHHHPLPLSSCNIMRSQEPLGTKGREARRRIQLYRLSRRRDAVGGH